MSCLRLGLPPFLDGFAADGFGSSIFSKPGHLHHNHVLPCPYRERPRKQFWKLARQGKLHEQALSEAVENCRKQWVNQKPNRKTRNTRQNPIGSIDESEQWFSELLRRETPNGVKISTPLPGTLQHAPARSLSLVLFFLRALVWFSFC